MLNDFPIRDPLAPRTNEDKLGNMKDALWDLQSMIKEVELYLDPKNLGSNGGHAVFAYGNDGYLKNGTTKAATQNNLHNTKAHWQKEFDALREMMLLCIENFDSECDAASELYKRTETRKGPRIREIRSELQGMPPPYAAICRDQDKRITSDKLREKFQKAINRRYPESQGRYGTSEPILLATESYDANPRKNGRQGDDETSGNPVNVRGWLNFTVDRAGEAITAYLGANFTEYGSDYSGTNFTTELGASISATAFATDGSATDPDVGPNFPSTCKIDKDYPFAGRELQISLETTKAPMTSRFLGTVPPGAPGAFIPSAGLSNDIKVRDKSYGYVEKLSSKNQHTNFFVTQRDANGYRDRGILNSLSCTPDTSGNDRHRGSGNDVDKGASCSDLDIRSMKINFYPREDDTASQRNTKLNRLKKLEIIDILKRKKTVPPIIVSLPPLFSPPPAPSSDRPVPSTPTPITSTGSGGASCSSTIQGKIAWDASGTRKTWSQNNISRLCAGATTSPEPATCFKEIMRGGHDNGSGGTTWGWSKAIDLCAGTTSSANTVACYSREVRSNGHEHAMQSCKR